MAGKSIVELTGENFELEVEKSNVPVMVDFWAQWCGPCRTVAPIMEELAVEYEGRAKVAKVNVDDEVELSSKFRIMSIPTIMVFKNGQMAEKVIGARSKEELSALLDKNL